MNAHETTKDRVIDELIAHETSYLMNQLNGDEMPLAPCEMRDKIESLRTELKAI